MFELELTDAEPGCSSQAYDTDCMSLHGAWYWYIFFILLKKFFIMRLRINSFAGHDNT